MPQIVRFERNLDSDQEQEMLQLSQQQDYPRMVHSSCIETNFLLKWNGVGLKRGEIPTNGAILHTQHASKISLSKPTRQYFVIASNFGKVRIMDFRCRVIFEEMWVEAPVLNLRLTPRHLILLYAKRMVLINRGRLLEELKKGNFEGAPLHESVFVQFEMNGHAKVLDAWMMDRGTMHNQAEERCDLAALDMLQIVQQYELEKEQKDKDEAISAFKSLICVGEKPALAAYILDQNFNNLSAGASNMFSATKLASKYATKLSSSLVSAMSFFSRPSSESTDPAGEGRDGSQNRKRRNFHPIEPAYYFDDTPREIYSVHLEERHNRHGACVDSLGRVILFEPQSLHLIHVFKGYRDAHVRFVSLNDEQYLLLYAPLRGLVEIWSLPFLSRVEAFQVERKSTLVDVEMARIGGTEQGTVADVYFTSPKTTALYCVQWRTSGEPSAVDTSQNE